MSTQRPPQDPERDPRVKAVFDDMRATRQTDFINSFWRTLAFDAALLERTWAEVKDVMRAKGMTDAQYAELLSIVAVAGKTNQLATALQVPVDAVFNADATR
jgi:alkylhydroperoxidase family enzyme